MSEWDFTWGLTGKELEEAQASGLAPDEYGYAFDEDEIDDEEDAKKTIIPFQLAYAVSIHKAQGLEYDSVKVIIPSVNSEKITKGVFYTAITRTKKKLTIYWSSETMEAIISGFSSEHSGFKSLDIIKNKLAQL